MPGSEAGLDRTGREGDEGRGVFGAKAASLVGVESNYSDPLALPTTTNWADVAGGGNPSTPPDGAANFGDIQRIVLGFQGIQTAPKVWLDLAGLGSPQNVPDFSTINFSDIQFAAQGFQGAAFPYTDPCTCAGLTPCP